MRAIADQLTVISMEAYEAFTPDDGGILDVIGGTSDDDVLIGTNNGDAITGLAGNDDLYGQGGDDTLSGGAGDDILQGSQGDDKLGGGAGDDVLNGGTGHDVLNGGGGYDIGVLQALGSTPVSIDLSGFVAGQTTTFIYDAAGDSATFIGIEKISVYGTVGDDTLVGADSDDHLTTAGGSDFVNGRGGADVIDDYDGDSTLIGGDGDDVINVHDATYTGLDWVLAATHDTIEGGAGQDTLMLDWNNVTSAVTTTKQHGHILFSSADGQVSADVTGIEAFEIGVGAAATLTGGAGDDSLGATSSAGGPGDRLTGGAGDDTMVGGAANDTLAGGAGSDTYILFQGAHQSGSTGLLYDASSFSIGAGKSVFADNLGGHDTVSGFEKVEIFTLDPGNDTAIGSAGDDTIHDGFGSDSLSGGAGDDLILQTSELVSDQQGQIDMNDTLDGGVGVDTLSFADAFFTENSPGWTFDLTAGTVTGFFTGTDTVRNFEHIIGSGAPDIILGSHLAETLEGGGGDDSLSGGGGRDVLAGGAGDDILSGGAGGDLLTGGDGSDTFVFTAVSDGVGKNIDKIIDLAAADVIDLSAIDADIHAAGDQAFVLVSAFDHHAGELMLSVKGKVTTLAADVDGDGVADFTVLIKGDHHDFVHFVL